MNRKCLTMGWWFFLVLPSCTQKTGQSQGQPGQPASTTSENGSAIDLNSLTSGGLTTPGSMVYYGFGTDLQALPIQLQGYLLPRAVAPEAEACRPRPGAIACSIAIIAVPGRLGLNEAFKKSLSAFSLAGFSVLAVDLYNQVPASLAEGKTLETELGQKGLPDILANLSQARTFVTQRLQPSLIILVGWDTGGKWAATAALTTPGSFAAVVSYASSLSVLKEYKPGDFSVPILGFFAAQDAETPAADMITIGAQYQKQHAPVTFQLIQNVQGNFMDPASSTYQPSAAAGVLQTTMTFLRDSGRASLPEDTAPHSTPSTQTNGDTSGAPF